MDLVTRESHARVTARLRGFASLAPLAAHSRPTPVVNNKSLQSNWLHHRSRDPTVSWRGCGVASALCGIGAVANNPCRGRSWSRGLSSEPVQELPPPQETIDHGDVARRIERVHALHLRTPIGSYFAHLDFFIRFGVQLEDAIDDNSRAVARGAVLSRSIELTVVLEDPSRRPCRANVALYGVGTMGSPGPQG